MTLHPVTGEVLTEDQELYVFPATHYVAGPERMERAIAGHRGRARGAARDVRAAGQAAGGAAAADAHDLRHRDDAPGRLLLRHRELLDAHRRPHPRVARPTACSTTSPRTSCSSSTSPTSRCRRSAACTRATCPASATWSTTASGCRARWTTGRCGGRSSSTGSARPSTSRRRPGNYELDKVERRRLVEQIIRPTGLIDPEVVVKPTKGQIDDLIHEITLRTEQERAGPGHDADQEDVRGPHRLPPRRRHPHPLPPLRGRHPQADRAAPRPAARRLRRPGRHQPAARGPRPARGVAGVDPRRRQGGLPALRQVADPDDRPRGPQRVRPGAHVRRQDHAVDGVGDRRDQPAPGQAGRLQHRARDRPDRRCARRSPTSPRCWPARTRTPRRCSQTWADSAAKGRAGGVKAQVAGAVAVQDAASAAARPRRAAQRPSWPT